MTATPEIVLARAREYLAKEAAPATGIHRFAGNLGRKLRNLVLGGGAIAVGAGAMGAGKEHAKRPLAPAEAQPPGY